MNVESTIQEIVANHLGVPVNEITPKSYLQDDLNADPLTLADLVVSLEDEFKVEIPPEESQKFETVEDIINFIADKIGEV
jgi:acyl carrier protein